jgi:hypothetical protein
MRRAWHGSRVAKAQMQITVDFQPQARCEHSSPGAVQMPQLGLQQTLSMLHVVKPHAWLAGYWMALSQRF